MKTYGEILGDGGSDVLGQVNAQQERLRARMAKIHAKVAVLSGKGGVGKSVIVANLAAAFAKGGLRVGVLDADINGPSLGKMLGVRGQRLAFETAGVQPALGPLGIRVLSMDLFLPSDETPVLWTGPTEGGGYLWRGAMEAATLREFLADTEWGELDLLLLDLPPGTDRIPSLLSLLPELHGIIIVTLPSQVSQLIVAKSVTMAKEIVKAPILGLVENMAAHRCAHCGAEEALFAGEDSAQMAERLAIPFLGRVPFDPVLTRCADEGTPVLLSHPTAPAAQALSRIAAKIGEALHLTPALVKAEESP
jgi:ATP-binding protein involved in chromosome partitioning